MIRYWMARLLASDPGLTRLQRASRVTLSVMTAVLVMNLVNMFLAHAPMTVAILSGVLGLIGSLVVNDPTAKEKKITTWLLALSSSSFITLASWLSLVGFHLPDLVLLSIVFLTFYLSRFGSRYFSLCMVGFISFYFSSLLQIQFAQLPWFYVAIFVGVSVAYTFNFIFFKDRPERLLKRSMSSFHVQINLTFDLMIDMIRDLKTSQKRVKSLNRNITKLNEYVRMVSGHFESTDPGVVWPGIQKHQLRLYIFDAAMLVETLPLTLKRLKDLHALEKADVRDSLLKVMQSLRDAEVLRESFDPANLKNAENTVVQLKQQLDQLQSDDKAFEKWLYLLRRIESIASHIVMEAKSIQEARNQHLNDHSNNSLSSQDDDEQANDDEEDSEEELEPGLQPTTKKAFQAALAGSLSIVLGYIVSPAHQYWILLSAFVILFGTESVGRTFVKAGQRFAGTLFGAIVGFGLAHLISGHIVIEITVLFFCIFMAFYLLSISYALMIFWITMMIAIMYDFLLGGVTEQLLGARVLDTFIGAGLGAGVTAFLFPHKTRDKVRDSMVEFLDNLKVYTEAYLEKYIGETNTTDLADKALELDEQLQQVRDDADPLLKRPGNFGRSGIENQLTVLTAMNFYVKHLVSSTKREQRAELNDDIKQALKGVEADIGKNIDILCEWLNENTKEHEAVLDLKREREFIERSPDLNTAKQLIHDLYYIWRINKAVLSLAKDLGSHSEMSIRSDTKEFY